MKIDLTIDSPVCFIPAKGNSRRLPHKNKLLLNGKPLVTYPIEAAISSGIFPLVIVSSNDEEILEIAYEAGATPHKRQESLCEDNVWLKQVVRFLLRVYRASQAFCLMSPTNPFVTAEDLKRGWDMFQQPDVNYVISVRQYRTPPQIALEKDANYLKFHYERDELGQSQDMLPLYYDDNGFTFASTQVFLQEYDLSFYGSNCVPYELEQSVDIDTRENFDYAEYLLRRRT